MTNFERLEQKPFFYKMGVCCGNNLYSTYKFDSFEKMMNEAISIDNKYNDMKYCTFVFQAFKDTSYDFEKSCFWQEEVSVNNIVRKVESLAEDVWEAFEGEVQENDN